jgi:hypothetical protein
MPITTVNAQKRQPIAKWSGSDEPQSYYSHVDDDTATLNTHEVNYIRWYQSRDHSKWRNADEENDVRVAAAAKAIVREIARETTTIAPPVSTSRVSSSFWTTPLSIASGEEPVFEPEHPDLEDERLNIPFMNLTNEQRAEKSKNFKFGLCCDCDYGLQDEIEFVYRSGANGCAKMCNACHYYHIDLFEKNNDGEHGGCN